MIVFGEVGASSYKMRYSTEVFVAAESRGQQPRSTVPRVLHEGVLVVDGADVVVRAARRQQRLQLRAAHAHVAAVRHLQLHHGARISIG